MRSVIVFTDEPASYANVFGQIHSKIFLMSSADAASFNFEEALSEWSGFQNREILSSFEVQQLNLILKKFVK